MLIDTWKEEVDERKNRRAQEERNQAKKISQVESIPPRKRTLNHLASREEKSHMPFNFDSTPFKL